MKCAEYNILRGEKEGRKGEWKEGRKKINVISIQQKNLEKEQKRKPRESRM